MLEACPWMYEPPPTNFCKVMAGHFPHREKPTNFQKIMARNFPQHRVWKSRFEFLDYCMREAALAEMQASRLKKERYNGSAYGIMIRN